MKYLDEFQDPALAERLLAEITAATTRPWAIMEVCGGQTHSIIRNGIDQVLPDGIELIHGPGCPVCVTPLEMIDRALRIAARPEVIFCSFGDMLRVPGSTGDLFAVKARGGDVRVVYSPLDAVTIAADNPDREVVFFAVGFETTAPANAMAVHQARERGLGNFSMLVSHVLVPPAMEAIMSSPSACSPRSAPSRRGPGRSWRSAAGRRTRSSATASTSCSRRASSSSTARAARCA